MGKSGQRANRYAGSFGLLLWIVCLVVGNTSCSDETPGGGQPGLDAAISADPTSQGEGSVETSPFRDTESERTRPTETGVSSDVAGRSGPTSAGGTPAPASESTGNGSTGSSQAVETGPPGSGNSDSEATGNSGTFTGEDAQVHIPDGAFEGDLVVTINQGTQIAADGEWTYYSAGPPIEFGPSGTVFSEPVSITLTFLPDVVGERPDLLVVAHRDDLTGQVTFIHPDSVDGTDITVSATSFSTFQPVMYRELMAGVVRDRTTSQPIAGAELFFYGSGHGDDVADSNGVYSFTLENLTMFGGALSGNLYVGALGYFEAPVVAVSDLGAQPSLPVVNDFTLLPSGPLVTGTITDASTGQGLDGVSVTFTRTPMSTFRGGNTTVQVTTDSSGNYAIDASFFAEQPSGEFSINLMIDADGYLGTGASIEFQGGPITRDFALVSNTGALLTGVVRDRETNQPVSGAQVFFYGSGHGTTTADANGVYTFTAADLSSFGGGFSGTLYVGSSGYFEAPPIPVADLATQVSLPVVNDVTLLPSAPLITGTITDSSSGAGLAGVTVAFTRSPMSTFLGGGTTEAVTTDNAGNYTIDPRFFAENPSGQFTVQLRVNFPGYFGITRDLTFFFDSSGSELGSDAGASDAGASDAGASDAGASHGTLIRDFALNSSAGPLLTGVVRDRNSNLPIAGAELFFYGSGYGNATADANGQYVFTIDDIHSFGGDIYGNLYVGKTGYFEAPAVTVSALTEQPTLPVVNDFTLLESAPLVTGVVTDANTGFAIDGATVSFSRTPMSTFRGGVTTVQVTTDSSGNYAIDPSNFAENPSGDFSVNLMVNATNYLGASRSLEFNGGPVVENVALTPGVSQ